MSGDRPERSRGQQCLVVTLAPDVEPSPFYKMPGLEVTTITNPPPGYQLRLRRRLHAAGLVLMALLSVPTACELWLRSLVRRYPVTAIERIPQAQAIVVLGGSYHLASNISNPSDRLTYAVQLYRAGKAPIVMCSGGQRSPGTEVEAEVMNRLLHEWGVPSEAILTEEQSRNTRGNAVFSNLVLQAKGIRRILLVTTVIHMPRAAAAFRKVGFEVTPAPIDVRPGLDSGRGLLLRLPGANHDQWSDGFWKEWIALLVYRLRGWA